MLEVKSDWREGHIRVVYIIFNLKNSYGVREFCSEYKLFIIFNSGIWVPESNIEKLYDQHIPTLRNHNVELKSLGKKN